MQDVTHPDTDVLSMGVLTRLNNTRDTQRTAKAMKLTVVANVFNVRAVLLLDEPSSSPRRRGLTSSERDAIVRQIREQRCAPLSALWN